MKMRRSAEQIKDPPYRVPLLLRSLSIRFQNLLDDRQIRSQLPLLPRLPQSITRRLRMGQNLLQRVPTQTVLPARWLNSFVRTSRRTSFQNSTSLRTPVSPDEPREDRSERSDLHLSPANTHARRHFQPSSTAPPRDLPRTQGLHRTRLIPRNEYYAIIKG